MDQKDKPNDGQAKDLILLICGLPGAGKSTLARALAGALSDSEFMLASASFLFSYVKRRRYFYGSRGARRLERSDNKETPSAPQ
jgi:energy-coupling factor transporter ATP-binding protein EcfA2